MKRQVTVNVTLGPDLLLSANPLEGAVREVAAPTLQASFEAKRDIYLEVEDRRDGQCRRQVVRTGYHPEREIMTGVGKIRAASTTGIANTHPTAMSVTQSMRINHPRTSQTATPLRL